MSKANRYDYWDVFLDNDKVDTVTFVKGFSQDEVKSALVNHDGYSSEIVVKKAKGFIR